MRWTDEKNAALAESWGKKPLQQLADELGCTPGAATSQAHKLRISRQAKGSRYVSPAQPAPSVPTQPFAPRIGPRDLRPPSACCWPIGEPRTEGFRFCEDPAEPGKPYCGLHLRRAYEKPIPRSTEKTIPTASPLTVRWAA